MRGKGTVDWGIILGVLGVGIVPATVGVGFVLADNSTAKEISFARGCFYLSAASFALTVLGTLWFYQEGTTTLRIASAALCGALIFGSLAAALDWTRGREGNSQEKAMPEGTGGKGGDAKVGGSGVAIGGPGGQAGKYGRGGDGGSAEVQGDGHAAGGAGGSVNDEGVWRHPAKSGYEVHQRALVLPVDPWMRPFGRGGAAPGYESKLQVVQEFRARPSSRTLVRCHSTI
jgi:hypothetical protein